MELRPLTPEDASSLHEAILESLDELRPWMPWAAEEPLPVEEHEALIRRWEDESEPGRARNYGMFDGDEVIGCCGFPREAGAGLEIGYWVRTSRSGQGVCPAAVTRLVDIAFADPAIPYVEIHHDEANVRSRRVPEKLGFDFVEKIPRQRAAPGETEVTWVWRLARG